VAGAQAHPHRAARGVLPKALRRVAKASTAAKPMLRIGNPLLDRNPAERPWEAKWAKLAREKQVCPQTAWQRVAGVVEKHRSVQKVSIRGGRADLDTLRSQMPLHDTADELCAVAKDLRLASNAILLGAKATETTLKGMNLTQYRVLHFATHGTIAGEPKAPANRASSSRRPPSRPSWTTANTPSQQLQGLARISGRILRSALWVRFRAAMLMK